MRFPDSITYSNGRAPTCGGARGASRPGGTTNYLYDRAGWLLAEALAGGTTETEYVWLDDLPLAVFSGVDSGTPTLFYVHPDHLNRPVKMTDVNENLVWDAIYSPFGTVFQITSSASNNMRFPGQYYLLESGLHYNWARHYDPTIGRYLQADPVGFVDGASIYGYVGQSPIMNTDPQGLYVAPFPPTSPLIRPLPPVPFMGPDNPSDPFLHPDDKDPCAGLRQQLQEHEQKLMDYIADPYKFDNKGFLGKGHDDAVIAGRIANLERQIENFRKQLKECEEKHERDNLACGPAAPFKGLGQPYLGSHYP